MLKEIIKEAKLNEGVNLFKLLKDNEELVKSILSKNGIDLKKARVTTIDKNGKTFLLVTTNKGDELLGFEINDDEIAENAILSIGLIPLTKIIK
jgi:hypothetical protein